MENNELIELQKELNKKTEEYNILHNKYAEIIRKQTITDAAEKYKFVNPASKRAFIALAMEGKVLNMATDPNGNDTFLTEDGKTAADIFAAFAETDDGKSFISCGNSGGGALGSGGRSSGGGGYRYSAEQIKGMNPEEIAKHLNEPSFIEYQCFKYTDSDGVESFRSDELREDIRTAWAIGNVDVQGVMHDSGVFAYVSKELGKSQNVEKALKRIQNGEDLKKNDTNKILMLWVVNTLAKLHEFKTGKKTVIRVIGYLKVYKVTAEEQQAEKERILAGSDLINNNTKTTQETENNNTDWSTEYTL